LSFLTLQGINKSFADERTSENIEVLKDINLSVGKSNFFTLFGPNACGKTTLLNIIAGLTEYNSGEISIDGKTPEDAAVGYMFQNYREYLLPWRTNIGNIALPLELTRNVERIGNKLTKKERYQKVNEFLKKLDIDIPKTTYPYQMSGGQQQLVAIATVLIVEPDVLLLDEPFAALDFETKTRMHDKILEIWRKIGTTVLFVSHEIEEAIYLADKIVLLTKRPAKIIEIIDNSLPRPRSQEMVRWPEFFDLRNKILDIVRQRMFS